MRVTSQVAVCPAIERCNSTFETDRIFLLIVQKSSKWPFYPLSTLFTIPYCCHNNVMDMGAIAQE